LRRINPKVICVSITAYGTSGPKADYADSELTAWAAGGALLAARETGGTPLRVSVPQAFLHAAADGAGGALVAHFARVQSGCGQHVDISAQQSAAQSTLSSILSAAVGHQDYSYRPEVKSKNKSLDLSGSGARTRRSKWRVSDGLVELHLAMGPAAGRFTNNLFAWMFEEGACDAALAAWDWTSLPARIESDEIVEADVERARMLVADFLAPRSKHCLAEAAMRRKLLLAPLATVADLVNSPHHRARGFFESVTDPFGRVLTLPGAFAMGTTRPCVPVTPAPALGQHNVDVYQGLLGLTDKEFAALKAAGAMG
jgi:crotonobetainyl-CoA:carnitine CoA-transferase CaiB-like acyl-CoA transferase